MVMCSMAILLHIYKITFENKSEPDQKKTGTENCHFFQKKFFMIFLKLLLEEIVFDNLEKNPGNNLGY